MQGFWIYLLQQEYIMEFTDIVFITEDVMKLIDFYEQVFQIEIDKNAIHTQFEIGNVKITLYLQQAAKDDMGFDFSKFNGTGKTTISFNVDDIDNEIERLQKLNVEFVTEPKVYPWGAKAAHFRDPDGNIIGFRSYNY